MISPSKRRFLPPLATKRDFNVYNEENAKRTKDEVDSEDLKETIKKLNKEIRKKKNEIKMLKDQNERSQSLLYKDLSDIEKIFIKLNNVKANERIKAFVNECNDTNKEKALAYLLQKQKEELNKRLLQRDKEIDMIKASERGFKFLNMNDKMISREEELSQKKKEYEDLLHNFQVLQYKYNYEYESNKEMISKLERNKMRIEGLKTRKEKLTKEKEIHEKGFNITNAFDSNRNENNIDNLKKNIDALCNQSEESEEKLKRKDNQIKSIENNIQTLMRKCKDIENEISCVMNNNSNTPSSEWENRLREVEEKKKMNLRIISNLNQEISEEQKKTNHIETELVKAQAQNKALDEILNEEQLTIKPLQDEFTSNEKSISYLQFTLSELKKKQTSLE